MLNNELGFPGSSVGEESACNAGDPGSTPGSGRSTGKGIDYPLQYHSSILGLPWWLSWWRIRLQRGRPGFDPWVGKTPWRRERLHTPVFWPGEFGLYSPRGCNWATFTSLHKAIISVTGHESTVHVYIFLFLPPVPFYLAISQHSTWLGFLTCWGD